MEQESFGITLSRIYETFPDRERERIENETGPYVVKFQESIIEMVKQGAYLVELPIKREFQRAIAEFCRKSGLKIKFEQPSSLNQDSTEYTAEVWGWDPKRPEELS